MGAFFRAGLIAGETCMIAPDTRRHAAAGSSVPATTPGADTQ
jgi:hypothetical protein